MTFSGDGLAHTSAPTKMNAKLEQLEEYTVRVPRDGTVHKQVFNGAPTDNLDTSLKMGPRGEISISDQTARERISKFDHERIPERVVHARGTGAHGEFVLHTSLSDVTCAKVLTEVGKKTPMFVRFSTVLGSSGAAETAREVRGFASRFYTEQGNWGEGTINSVLSRSEFSDIVGNNIPVFFIQDGVKFVDLIHAGKPEPQIHLPQAQVSDSCSVATCLILLQTAHDSFWDWISLTPESSHMIGWALSDYTIPRS
jgi:catalase